MDRRGFITTIFTGILVNSLLGTEGTVGASDVISNENSQPSFEATDVQSFFQNLSAFGANIANQLNEAGWNDDNSIPTDLYIFDEAVPNALPVINYQAAVNYLDSIFKNAPQGVKIAAEMKNGVGPDAVTLNFHLEDNKIIYNDNIHNVLTDDMTVGQNEGVNKNNRLEWTKVCKQFNGQLNEVSFTIQVPMIENSSNRKSINVVFHGPNSLASAYRAEDPNQVVYTPETGKTMLVANTRTQIINGSEN